MDSYEISTSRPWVICSIDKQLREEVDSGETLSFTACCERTGGSNSQDTSCIIRITLPRTLKLKQLHLCSNARFVEVYICSSTQGEPRYLTTIRGVAQSGDGNVSTASPGPLNPKFNCNFDVAVLGGRKSSDECATIELKYVSIKGVSVLEAGAAGISEIGDKPTLKLYLDSCSITMCNIPERSHLPGSSSASAESISASSGAAETNDGLMSMMMMRMMMASAAGSTLPIGGSIPTMNQPSVSSSLSSTTAVTGATATAATGAITPPSVGVVTAAADDESGGRDGRGGDGTGSDSFERSHHVKSDAVADKDPGTAAMMTIDATSVGAKDANSSSTSSSSSSSSTAKPNLPAGMSPYTVGSASSSTGKPAHSSDSNMDNSNRSNNSSNTSSGNLDVKQLASILWAVKSTMMQEFSDLIDKKLSPIQQRLDDIEVLLSKQQQMQK